jgi:hypothetical protein
MACAPQRSATLPLATAHRGAGHHLGHRLLDTSPPSPLDREHRLVYRIKGENIEIIACRYHYTER